MNADEREYGMGTAESEGNAFADVKIKKRGRVSDVAREIFVGFLYALCGYLLGICELPFGARPFGMAFLCAADKKVPYIFAGVCLSAFGSDEPVVWICAYAVALVIRILVRLTLDMPWHKDENSGERSVGEIFPMLFSENICLRMTTSCVGAFTVGIYSLIVGGFLYYDLWGAILAMLAAPAAVLLSYGGFRGKKEATKFGYLSSGAIAFATVYAARDVNIYGVSLAVFGAMLVTLYICRKKGIIHGIASGIICGLAYSPMLAPVFIFAAVASGALWRVSAVFASCAALTVGLAWGLYVSGIGAITALLPALLAASLLFAVLDKLFLSAKAEAVAERVGEEREVAKCEIGYGIIGNVRLDATEQRVKNICGTFGEMSAFFRDLGERTRKPLAADVKQICDDAFDACCANCRHRELCWEENYTDTIAAIASVSAKLHKSGRISNEDIPDAMLKICERMPDIIDEINHNCMLHTKQLLLCDKTEIFALDYEAMSDLLAGAMSIDGAELECDAEMSERICEAMNAEGIEVSAAVAYGTRRRRVVLGASSAEYLRKNRDRIISLVGRVCGERFFDCDVEEREDGRAYMTLSVGRRISVEHASRSVMAGSEKNFCGDTMSIFESGDDRFYALISDGMGSGRDAALTSGICVMFLQKMLVAASRCDTALKLLNGFLRNKGGGSMHECSATVDLMELDLIGGKASFYKSGAAPTYVFRNGSLFKLRSKTVPVGIIRELDAKKISFDVGDGDIIVMVSDGVTQGKDECPWLFELLKRNVESEGIERTAEMIVERAVRESGDDDISVVMIKINRE
ncbi:MAG: SpoIIE family protein phosphatase [Clostridia bacterium]|nr:SpoIIE family protein phosphatase [Clostridia bacterium]